MNDAKKYELEVGDDPDFAATALSINGLEIDPTTVVAPMRIVHDEWGNTIELKIRGPIAHGGNHLTASWTTGGVTYQLHPDGRITSDEGDPT